MVHASMYFIQGLILIAITPFFMGILKKLKANIRGYKGPHVFQVYYDYSKLIKKGRVISKSSSFITEVGPVFSLGASITAAFIVPVFYTGEINLLGNIYIVIFLMVISKFFNTLLGLDCASAFGGMGSSRELFISIFAEPILFVLVAFLYFETKSFNVYTISFINSFQVHYSIAHLIASAAFFPLLLAENCRMPVDNPETHLELTMVHEAMILDLSGRDLAYVEYASSIKMMVFISLFINTFFPFEISTMITVLALLKGIIFYCGKVFLCLLVIALLETSIAKYRLFRVPELLAGAFSIGLIGLAIGYFI